MNKLPLQSLKNPVNFLALGLGSGLIPKAPGTAGSVLAWLAALFFPILINGYIIIVVSIAGIFICRYSADKFNTHDHPAIVWDEFCGVWLTLYFVNLMYAQDAQSVNFHEQPALFWWWLAALVSFRFFDILKPWPISVIDRGLRGGIGIMLDDIIAALFAVVPLSIGLFVQHFF